VSGTPFELAADLDALARRTWERVRWGPIYGQTLREDGLTDENLFRLRRDHPYLNVKKFAPLTEAGNGADWEWWLGSDAAGWVGLRVQAKKMVNMRYAELGYRADSQTRIQCQVLVEQTRTDASGRALFPAYCFYNGWDESSGWPVGVDWTVGCPQPANCSVVPDVSIFGCGIADASQVLQVLRHHNDSLDARYTLPLQRPWSWLFTGGQPSGLTLSADGVLNSVVATLRLDRDATQQARYRELPVYAEATRAQWPEEEMLDLVSVAPTTYVVTTDLAALDLAPVDDLN
jgi:hypothetical protein